MNGWSLQRAADQPAAAGRRRRRTKISMGAFLAHSSDWHSVGMHAHLSCTDAWMLLLLLFDAHHSLTDSCHADSTSPNNRAATRCSLHSLHFARLTLPR